MTPADDPVQQPPRIDRRRLVVSLLGVPLFLALFLFLPAGTWAWADGWLFVLVFLTSCLLAALYVWRVNPELLAARVNPHRGTKGWDKPLLAAFLLTALAIFPVAALDAGRFRWSAVPGWARLLGYALLLAGMALLTWAQAVNKFFEPTVRIQADRGQRVIDTGPYAVVRHPGYLSWLPLSAGIALCLGSFWALIPAGLSSLVLVLRTRWEDQTLRAELAGYEVYAGRVRYRLFPGVW
jgi:protein-S-isoprenylcysteine O-methyltransferase Ste14